MNNNIMGKSIINTNDIYVKSGIDKNMCISSHIQSSNFYIGDDLLEDVCFNINQDNINEKEVNQFYSAINLLKKSTLEKLKFLVFLFNKIIYKKIKIIYNNVI